MGYARHKKMFSTYTRALQKLVKLLMKLLACWDYIICKHFPLICNLDISKHYEYLLKLIIKTINGMMEAVCL